MLQNENIHPSKCNIIEFSFGKPNNLKNNVLKLISDYKIKVLCNQNIDKESQKVKCKYIFSLLNKNRESPKKKANFILNSTATINNNQADIITKPKITVINSPNDKGKSIDTNIPNNNINSLTLYKTPFLFVNKIGDKKIKSEYKDEILKIFKIDTEENIPYEIKYFFDNPKFNCDFESTNSYINENFVDILLNSYNKKMLLNSNIKPLSEIQTEITYPKRNILISWLTEINYKYIQDQNILFTAILLLDRILFHSFININEFQIIGLICFNLALKMENHHKVFFIDEVITLIGEKEKKKILIKKINKIEYKICELLNFDLVVSTSVLILERFVQILNLPNKKVEKILLSISFFFLELSLYEEKFYELDDFTKALSSLIIAKEILSKCSQKIILHQFLINCAKSKVKEIKYFYTLCAKTIKNLKMYKYGNTLFIKYQHKDFENVINNYLHSFILECINDKS